MRTNLGCWQHWAPSAFPIPVIVDQDISPEYRDAAYQAASAWNLLLGEQIFVTRVGENVSPRIPGNIYITSRDLGDSSNEVRLLGLTNNTFKEATGRMKDSLVTMDLDLPEELISPVLIHELGHALGLRHDKDTTSIMYRSVNFDYCQTIEEDDLLAIRSQLSRHN